MFHAATPVAGLPPNAAEGLQKVLTALGQNAQNPANAGGLAAAFADLGQKNPVGKRPRSFNSPLSLVEELREVIQQPLV
jgi:hypothetical protein